MAHFLQLGPIFQSSPIGWGPRVQIQDFKAVVCNLWVMTCVCEGTPLTHRHIHMWTQTTHTHTPHTLLTLRHTHIVRHKHRTHTFLTRTYTNTYRHTHSPLLVSITHSTHSSHTLIHAHSGTHTETHIHICTRIILTHTQAHTAHTAHTLLMHTDTHILSPPLVSIKHYPSSWAG